MIHMGLQLLTVALESAPIANCQALLGLVKEELCRHLFQVSLAYARMMYGTGKSDMNFRHRVYWNLVLQGLAGLQTSSLLHCTESSELHQTVLLQSQRGCCAIFCRPGPRRMRVIWMNCYCGITLCFDITGFEVVMMRVTSSVAGRTFGGYQAINCTGVISEAGPLPSSFTTKSLSLRTKL